MNVLNREICEICTLDLLAGKDAICDGSGVLAITDYPSSRVSTCPAWPVDEDEPAAYYEAIEGLHYDDIPPTMQQRIRDNVMAEVQHTQQRTRQTEPPFFHSSDCGYGFKTLECVCGASEDAKDYYPEGLLSPEHLPREASVSDLKALVYMAALMAPGLIVIAAVIQVIRWVIS